MRKPTILTNRTKGVAVIVLASAFPAWALTVSSKPAEQNRRASTLAAAAEIDGIVAAKLESRGVAPNAMSESETFVRRVYLDIVGRVPTAIETTAFLASKDRDKRAQLIDELLDSPGYASRMFHFWADLLRVKSRLANQISGEPYIHWLKDAIDRNLPYDQLVTELLTAEGPAHQRDNGATGYFMRDRGMPQDNMANTMQVFLGTRLECAQCHNHPFRDWTQKEYFQMVAFTGGIEYRINMRESEAGRRFAEMGQVVRQDLGNEGARVYRRMLQPAINGITGSGTGMVKLPHDYQYDDAQPDQWIHAETIFGEKIEIPSSYTQASSQKGRTERDRRRDRRRQRRFRPQEVDSREVFAEWLTSANNELFRQVVANRMWKWVMGVGVIEPTDDMNEATAPMHPELMQYLENLMVQVNFDLKEFLRVLFNTKTYQREASATEFDPAEEYLFQGPVLRRMSAEQIWDSMLTLVVPNLDQYLSPPKSEQAETVYSRYEELTSLSSEEIVRRVEYESLRYTDPDAYRARRRQEQQEQRRLRDEERQKARPQLRELAKARRNRDAEKEQELLAQLQEMGIEPNRLGGNRSLRDLKRASDLPSPAPAGHFLDRFGQSDRETIDGAFQDATIPQALSLLNGFLEERILSNSQSVLMQTLQAASSPEDKIEAAFLSILNRKPENYENRMWKGEVKADPVQGCKDLVWTLINTHEFLFIQ